MDPEFPKPTYQALQRENNDTRRNKRKIFRAEIRQNVLD